MRPVPPGWGPAPRPGWGYCPPPPGRRPELGGVTALVLVTLLAALAAPHARVVRGKLAGIGGLPAISLPKPKPPASPPATRVPPGLGFTNGAGCRPASDWTSPRLDRRIRALLVTVAARHRIRISCLRSGHSWYVKGTRRVSNHSVWRGGPAERDRLAVGLWRPALVHRLRPPGPPACRLCRPDPGRWPVMAGLWDLLGWPGLTAAEQACAVTGAATGLAAVLLARALFGGRRRR